MIEVQQLREESETLPQAKRHKITLLSLFFGYYHKVGQVCEVGEVGKVGEVGDVGEVGEVLLLFLIVSFLDSFLQSVFLRNLKPRVQQHHNLRSPQLKRVSLDDAVG